MMTEEQMVDEEFLAVMNANDRELSLPLTAWAERNLLKRRIAVAVRFARAKAREEALDEVERHLSACQYDPAPYTAMKYRLRALKPDSGITDKEAMGRVIGVLDREAGR